MSGTLFSAAETDETVSGTLFSAETALAETVQETVSGTLFRSPWISYSGF